MGIELPKDDEKLFERFLEEGEKISTLLDGKDPVSLYDLHEKDDPELTRKHEILFDLFADGYLMGRSALLVCGAAISTRLTMEKGICPMSSIGFVNYATCLCASGQYELGHAFGQVAVKLADKYQVASLKNYTYHLILKTCPPKSLCCMPIMRGRVRRFGECFIWRTHR